MTGNRGCQHSSETEDRAEGREVVDDKEVVTGEKERVGADPLLLRPPRRLTSYLAPDCRLSGYPGKYFLSFP